MRAWIGLPGVASGGSMRSVKLRAYIYIYVKVGPMAPAAVVLERPSVHHHRVSAFLSAFGSSSTAAWYRIGGSINAASATRAARGCLLNAPPIAPWVAPGSAINEYNEAISERCSGYRLRRPGRGSVRLLCRIAGCCNESSLCTCTTIVLGLKCLQTRVPEIRQRLSPFLFPLPRPRRLLSSLALAARVRPRGLSSSGAHSPSVSLRV